MIPASRLAPEGAVLPIKQEGAWNLGQSSPRPTPRSSLRSLPSLATEGSHANGNIRAISFVKRAWVPGSVRSRTLLIDMLKKLGVEYTCGLDVSETPSKHSRTISHRERLLLLSPLAFRGSTSRSLTSCRSFNLLPTNVVDT